MCAVDRLIVLSFMKIYRPNGVGLPIFRVSPAAWSKQWRNFRSAADYKGCREFLEGNFRKRQSSEALSQRALARTRRDANSGKNVTL